MDHGSPVTGIERRSLRFFNILLTLLFIAVLSISILFAINERDLKVRAEMDRVAQIFTREFAETLRLSVESLRATSNLIVFREDISFQQFQDITAQNFDADRGLLIIEWQPRVPGADRTAFENNARQRGIPDFRLWEPDNNGNPIAAQERSEHIPVYFMRSRDMSDDTISTLGLDLAWSPERMQSKWDARDTGRARSSPLFNVVTGQDSSYQPLGYAITLPVYGSGYVPTDPDRRPRELIGYMAGVYVLEDVIAEPLTQLQALGFHVDIHDQGHDHRDSVHRLLIQEGPATAFRHTAELDLYGSTLHLEITATGAFVDAQFEVLWLLLPASVLAIGALTFWFLARLESRQRQLVSAQKELTAANAQLEEQSRHDPLTGVFNRRAFEERARQEIDRAERHQQPVSLLMLDLDHFKNVNDRWGHYAGDRVLEAFATICKQATRNFDTVARWGGEEFAIILAHTDSKAALQFADRLRREVKQARIPVNNLESEVQITVSIGISTVDGDMAAGKWMEQADKALYLAKRSGRDCVRVFE